MLSKKLSLTALAGLSMALAGCHFYVQDGESNDGDWVQPGDDCSVDNDICAPGCFCASDDFGAYCEESGFCDDNFPCPEGYTCGRDGDGDGTNETCVPGEEPPPPPACTENADCNLGDVCDADTGECRAATSCDEHTTKDSCEADQTNDCDGVNRGINCTHPTGGDCELDPEPCTCESFEFIACIDAPTE